MRRRCLMHCADILPLLAARRELAWGQERQLQEHLAACPTCLARWTREEQLLARLRGVPTPAGTYPQELDRRVRSALARRRPARRPVARLALAGALCAALALLLINV